MWLSIYLKLVAPIIPWNAFDSLIFLCTPQMHYINEVNEKKPLNVKW